MRVIAPSACCATLCAITSIVTSIRNGAGLGTRLTREESKNTRLFGHELHLVMSKNFRSTVEHLPYRRLFSWVLYSLSKHEPRNFL